jgi:hypothetical protein
MVAVLGRELGHHATGGPRPLLIATWLVVGRVSGVLARLARLCQLSVLLGRFARLGCTRIGSPGIFG